MNLMKLRNLGDRFATWAILMVTSSLMAASMAVPCFGQGVTLALEPTETCGVKQNSLTAFCSLKDECKGLPFLVNTATGSLLAKASATKSRTASS